MLLYDVRSTYLKGKACPLAKYGYNREKKRSKLQIVFGLLCNDKGCPIAVKVFEGNTSDLKTLTNQIDKVCSRFGIKRVLWVRDRGMITQERIREDLKDKEGLDWIRALRASASNKEISKTISYSISSVL
ncbi:Mobile element protein [Richelia intracellularis]|nr:Mobile element protein [Richelia intracellularis]